jgi:hypothetical protein
LVSSLLVFRVFGRASLLVFLLLFFRGVGQPLLLLLFFLLLFFRGVGRVPGGAPPLAGRRAGYLLA